MPDTQYAKSIAKIMLDNYDGTHFKLEGIFRFLREDQRFIEIQTYSDLVSVIKENSEIFEFFGFKVLVDLYSPKIYYKEDILV